MRTVREIYDALFAFAPERMKMGDWDNVGLLCGRFLSTVLRAHPGGGTLLSPGAQ